LRKLIALHEIAEILLKVSLNTHQSILFFEETRVPGENKLSRFRFLVAVRNDSHITVTGKF
jgi:hypothetical protein